MKKHLHSLLSLPAVLLIATVLAPALEAQTYKDVEVEIAGPWGYVPDKPGVPRVFVIAPSSTDHKLAIFPGGDATDYANSSTGPHPGSYNLILPDFDPTKCPPANKMSLPLHPVKVNDTSLGLGAKDARYLISLPIPCSYESYVEARAKIDTNAIHDTTPEKSYTIWMIFHYWVPTTSQTAFLDGDSDDKITKYSNYSLPLVNSSNPSTAQAASIVLYNTHGQEQHSCDQHSAEFFDLATKQLWNKPFNRLFPELHYGGPLRPGVQTHRYNDKTCAQLSSDHGLAMESKKDSHPDDLPDNKYPGRADCHAPQLNINAALPGLHE